MSIQQLETGHAEALSFSPNMLCDHPNLSIETLCLDSLSVPICRLKSLCLVAVSPAHVGPGHGHTFCLRGRTCCGSHLVIGDGGCGLGSSARSCPVAQYLGVCLSCRVEVIILTIPPISWHSGLFGGLHSLGLSPFFRFELWLH